MDITGGTSSKCDAQSKIFLTAKSKLKSSINIPTTWLKLTEEHHPTGTSHNLTKIESIHHHHHEPEYHRRHHHHHHCSILVTHPYNHPYIFSIFHGVALHQVGACSCNAKGKWLHVSYASLEQRNTSKASPSSILLNKIRESIFVPFYVP